MQPNKLYYLIRKDGSAVFFQPYCIDFLTHCLIILENRGISTLGYRLLGEATFSYFPLPSFCLLTKRTEEF